jgi:RNA-directed DNA polymerase
VVAGGQYESSVATVADRVVQAALKLVLEPIFEADFQPCSYGFRPGRRAHDAIAEIQLFATQGTPGRLRPISGPASTKSGISP